MRNMEIQEVVGRQILDSRGNPTVEAQVTLEDGTSATGAAPSGASTGEYEAHELRDGDPDAYMGKGVMKAVKHVNEDIAKAIIGIDAMDMSAIDSAMKKMDGTKTKSNFGANAILAVSIAAAKAAAASLEIPLYRFLGGAAACQLPVPLMNILNGGAHASNSVDFQEFMIMPVGADSFSQALRMGTECYHSLKAVLKEKGLATAVGDEGGFAPDVASVEEVLELLESAVKLAGYTCGTEICFALDVAASEWKSKKGKGYYHLPKSGKEYTSSELIKYYDKLIKNYPIISIEDPLDEEDWEAWKNLTEEFGQRVQLVGDDLFVTNTERLSKGIEQGCGNSILIKPNQIGSLSETMAAIRVAHQAGYTAIASHRSGETEDTTIAHLAVALNMGQIKTGAPCRTERVAKYNELLRIEELLGKNASYFFRKQF